MNISNTTRFTAALLTVAALALTTGCSDAEDLDNFDVEVEDVATVEGGGALEVLLNGFPELDTFTRFDISQTSGFKNSKYSSDDVDSVVLEEMELSVVSPDGQDLSFLGSVVVYVEAEGLARKEIARKDSFAKGETLASFTTTSDDIKAYVLAREGTIDVEVSDSKRPDQDTDIKLRALFDVDVNVF